MHEQDNQKILRKDGVEKLLVEEKGINSYKRSADKDCDPARKYWEKNKEYWSKVRAAWESYVATQSTIQLKEPIDGKVLHEYLMSMARDYAEKKIKPENLDAAIKEGLEKYLRPAKDVAGN